MHLGRFIEQSARFGAPTSPAKLGKSLKYLFVNEPSLNMGSPLGRGGKPGSDLQKSVGKNV